MTKLTPDRWEITDEGSIVWDVENDTHLPHEDHIEMSGRQVSVIVRYRADADRRLHLTHEVIWPTFRTQEGDVRGYLKRIFHSEEDLTLRINGRVEDLPPVSEIHIGPGVLIITHSGDLAEGHGLEVTRSIFPALDAPVVYERWHVVSKYWSIFDQSKDDATITLGWDFSPALEEQSGVYGTYRIETRLLPPEKTRLTCIYDSPDWADMTLVFRASILPADSEIITPQMASDKRIQRIQQHWQEGLALATPDNDLNVAFKFAAYRAADSLFETKMGLVHSPGGGRYYGGIWNNDQCEYSGPLFGYLGDADAKLAALTAYRNFAPYMTPDYKPIPTSLEMEGTIPIHAGGDRGDAAMYASGATRFVLTTGDRAIAEELYPYIAWCLEYCRCKTNTAGVVESDCDELEKRFPAGDANLSTACLYYDGLRRAADLARDLDKMDDAAEYTRRADVLETAIETHFGAMVEGYDTYRYYEGNTTLRAWICLPLVFGISKRATETLDALFSDQMWSPDGLATEAGKPDFWDRSTLYALRGAFFAGDTERAYEHLLSYSCRRLLGEHVPYPVEAYPEGDQAHLSAESALYCRIFIEGILGMVPTGLHSFTLTPRLPAAWSQMKCTLPAFGHRVEILVKRDGAQLQVQISAGKFILYQGITPGDTLPITLPLL